MAKLILPGASPQLLWDTFDFIGDSRCAAISSTVGGQLHGTGATHWFPWVRAMSQHKYKLGLALGLSGYTTDQYINANLAQALASKSGWLVFDKPCINDLVANSNGGVFPFTNTNGVVVTTSNVAQIAVGNIIAAATKALALGKRVLVTAEPGAANLQTAMLNQCFLVSDMLKAWADVTPNVTYYDPRAKLWNATVSTTGLQYKANFSPDGTHAYPIMAYTEAVDIKQMLDPLIIGNDNASFNTAMTNANYAREMTPNPLFNNLSGGVRTTIGGTGPVPAGMTISGLASSTCNITSVANANGWGNDITFACTTTVADSIKLLISQPSNALFTLNSYLTSGVDVDVAAGSTNAYVPYLTTVMGSNTNATPHGDASYDMYSNVTSWFSPSAAYSMRYRTPKARLLDMNPTATSIWYVQSLVNVIFSAAGTQTVTLRRPTFKTGLVYANGAFSG
jgi:hypothetical protein